MLYCDGKLNTGHYVLGEPLREEHKLCLNRMDDYSSKINRNHRKCSNTCYSRSYFKNPPLLVSRRQSSADSGAEVSSIHFFQCRNLASPLPLKHLLIGRNTSMASQSDPHIKTGLHNIVPRMNVSARRKGSSLNLLKSIDGFLKTNKSVRPVT